MKKKEDLVTKKYLDKKLDQKFKEHTGVIVAALDGVLDKRLGKMEERLEKKIDGVKNSIDGYINKQEGFKGEFTIMKEEMKQVKHVLKEKLGVEIQAV